MAAGTTMGNKADESASPGRVFPRFEQTFPTLTPQEIARMRRFSAERNYKNGERLFETGKPGPGMFVVLSGHVAITQRDGFGRVTPIIDQGPGFDVAKLPDPTDPEFLERPKKSIPFPNRFAELQEFLLSSNT